MSKENEKAVRMGILIAGQIMEIFNEEESHFYINESELEDDATAFVYAVACVAPAIVYGKLTGNENINFLEFNHIANRLCFQYGKMIDEEIEEVQQ